MLYYTILDFSAFTDEQTEAVRQRIKRHFSDGKDLKRKESVAVRALLCFMLNKCFGLTDFTISSDSNGKPYIKNSDLHFNLSHSGSRALCVCGNVRIGCDIEKIKACNEKVAERFFCKNECAVLRQSEKPSRAFTRLWTLKESVLKFTGEGISGGLDCYDFSEYYKEDKFSLNGLIFNSFEEDGFSVSICSENSEIIQLEVVIGDII